MQIQFVWRTQKFVLNLIVIFVRSV